jgi:hypothetical protein
VDLRHQRRVHETGLLVERLVVEVAVLRVQVVADRVVLAHEQRVEKGEADPEVARDALQVDQLLELRRRQALVVDLQLPVLARAERVGEPLVPAVDVRAVPPVRVLGRVRRRPARVGARIALRARDLHRVLVPGVPFFERQLPGALLLALAVAEPVVHLELDPGAGQEVQRRRRRELVARQQAAADEAGVWFEQRLVGLGPGELERDVPPEACVERAHLRVVEVVVRPVIGPRREVVAGVLVRLGSAPALARVVQVLLPEPAPEADERQDRERQRKAVPPQPPIQPCRGSVERRREDRAHACSL